MWLESGLLFSDWYSNISFKTDVLHTNAFICFFVATATETDRHWTLHVSKLSCSELKFSVLKKRLTDFTTNALWKLSRK